MANLTKAQRVFLRIVSDLGGTAHVFPDQWSTASMLEARGLLAGNGKHIDRQTSITDAGRNALAEAS